MINTMQNPTKLLIFVGVFGLLAAGLFIFYTNYASAQSCIDNLDCSSDEVCQNGTCQPVSCSSQSLSGCATENCGGGPGQGNCTCDPSKQDRDCRQDLGFKCDATDGRPRCSKTCRDHDECSEGRVCTTADPDGDRFCRTVQCDGDYTRCPFDSTCQGGEGETCQRWDKESEGGLVPCGGQIHNERGEIAGQEAPCEFRDLFVMLHNIIEFLIFTIAPLLVVLMMTVGGFMILAAGGSPAQLNTGKNMIKWALIGYAVIFSSWLIVNTILTQIGAAEWVNVGQWWNLNI